MGGGRCLRRAEGRLAHRSLSPSSTGWQPPAQQLGQVTTRPSRATRPVEHKHANDDCDASHGSCAGFHVGAPSRATVVEIPFTDTALARKASASRMARATIETKAAAWGASPGDFTGMDAVDISRKSRNRDTCRPTWEIKRDIEDNKERDCHHGRVLVSVSGRNSIGHGSHGSVGVMGVMDCPSKMIGGRDENRERSGEGIV